jgi:hypothetical protein
LDVPEDYFERFGMEPHFIWEGRPGEKPKKVMPANCETYQEIDNRRTDAIKATNPSLSIFRRMQPTRFAQAPRSSGSRSTWTALTTWRSPWPNTTVTWVGYFKT